MKFNIREGFVVHLARIVETAGQKMIQEASYYDGQSVELTRDEAADHLHKLEPADKESAKFIESNFAPVVAPAASPIDPVVLAAAVAATLAAMGIVAPAAPVVPAQ